MKNTYPRRGIDLISQERIEQIVKHRRTIPEDYANNDKGQLPRAAYLLLIPDDSSIRKDMLNDYFFVYVPDKWDSRVWAKMINKPFEQRLVIAGALLAAELDRRAFDEHITNK